MHSKEKSGGNSAPSASGSNADLERWRKRIIAVIEKIKSQRQRVNLERLTQNIRIAHSISPQDFLLKLEAQV